MQLPEPVRFSEQWEQAASLGLREGRVSALADYAEHGRIRAGAAEEVSAGGDLCVGPCSLVVMAAWAVRQTGAGGPACGRFLVLGGFDVQTSPRRLEEADAIIPLLQRPRRRTLVTVASH